MNEQPCKTIERLQKRVLCLWLPNWPIQRLVVTQKELKRQRVVLFRQDSRRGQLVSAVSPLATRDAIQIDMPISEAKSLLKRSNSQSNSRTSQPFYIFEHDRVADKTTLESLADQLHEFSPIVGLEQTDCPSSLFFDVTGLAHLFGNETCLANELFQKCKELGYLSRIAIANTVGLALGLTRYGTDESDPKNPVMVTTDDPTTTLGSLPIAALRLAPPTQETLEQLGVQWVNQLFQLSRSDLATRFGNEINDRVDQATGKVDEPIVARHQPPEFQAEKFLDFPTNDRETIEVVLSRLVQEICKQMKARQQGALQWTVHLRLQEGLPIEFRVNLFQPTATVEQVMQLAQMQLAQALQPHTRRRKRKPNQKSRAYTTFQVCEIIVCVTSCVLLVERQRQLFDENPRLDKQSLAHLINRLTTRLGQENVVYPTMQSGAQPEFAVRFRPLIDPRRRRNRKSAKPKATSQVMSRPLRLLNPPIEIDSHDVQRLPSQKIRYPPSLLIHDGYRQKIVHSWGPERIETGWWRGPTVRRDYWRVETDTGQQFWIYRNLRTQKWFLHGEF